MKTRYTAGVIFAVIMLALGAPALAADTPNPDKMPWRTDVKKALEEANEKGLPIIINFTTSYGSG